MYCQACGHKNDPDDEYCRRCHQKLLVVSGAAGGAAAAAAAAGEEEVVFDEAESFSLDEHLLERISILEEAVKRTTEGVRQLLAALRKHERSILASHAGVDAVRELLGRRELVGDEEWSRLWESKMEFQLESLERREQFEAVKERIIGLYRGGRSGEAEAEASSAGGAPERRSGGRRHSFLGHLEDAEVAFYAQDTVAAVQALDRALELDPENHELACFLGELCFNEGQPQRALAYFRRILEVEPQHYEGLVFTGVLLHEEGEDERAEELLKRAVAGYPELFLPNFSLGAVYASLGDLSRAVCFLERADEIEAMPQARFLLGRCYYEMGKSTAAIKALEGATRLDPAFEEAHHLLGLAYLDRRWNRKALERFKAAQRLNPKKLAYHDLVRYLTGRGDTPLPPVEGEAARWLAEGERQLEADELSRAATSYQRALELAPDNATLLISYAVLCLHLDRDQEIVSVTRKVLEGEPGEMLEATAYATLIAALRSQGKYREGNSIGSRLLDEERSPFTRTIAYYEMAYNLAEMEEDLDRALAYAQSSLELAPEELKQYPLAALGWVHYKRRELDEAVACLTRSSELGPSASTLTHLGMALLAAGDEERAREVLAQARDLGAEGQELEEKMLDCLKDSRRLFERVQRQKR